MRLAILSAKAELHSTQRLVAAATVRGLEPHVLSPLGCQLTLSAEGPALYYQGERQPAFAAVLPRVGHELTLLGATVLRQLQTLGSYSPTSAASLLSARDKFHALQLLLAQGLPMPATAFGSSPEQIPLLMAEVGGAPLVIKVLEGSQGIGVSLADSPQAARSTLEAFLGAKVNVLVQEFIGECAGQDIRLLVIGDKVVAAMARQAQDGDFRANLHCGGQAHAITPTNAECAIAIKAAQTLGLGIAGVDLLRSARGPLLLEVNSSPGLEGIEKACSLDIAGLMVDFVLANLQ